MNKVCKKCGLRKPLDDYYRHPTCTSDGHLGACKACINAYKVSHRSQKEDYYKLYDLARQDRPKRRAVKKRANDTAEKRYPEKYKATRAIVKAVAKGEIRREPCLICGVTVTQGHHEHYERPYDVFWLCEPHHKAIHRQLRYNPATHEMEKASRGFPLPAPRVSTF